MAGDPAILKRIRACPFARRSGEPLARLRLAGNGDEVVLLYPSHRGGWGALGDFGASPMPPAWCTDQRCRRNGPTLFRIQPMRT
jgi:hypothetical protein